VYTITYFFVRRHCQMWYEIQFERRLKYLEPLLFDFLIIKLPFLMFTTCHREQ